MSGGGTPCLSVVVPVYKVEAYLDACVQSILAQTFTDFELILVDDGSPDNCPALCDAWAERDGRVRVVHKENGGLSSARNAGMAIARGDYVAFVDSDDTIAPETYAVCMEKALAGGLQLVCFGYNIVAGPNGRQVTPVSIPAFEIKHLLELRPRFEEYTSTAALFGVAWNKLYELDFLRRHNLAFDEAILVNEDEPFNFAVLANLERMAYIDACYYNYYMRENASITRKGSVEVYSIGLAREGHAAAFFEAAPGFEDLKDNYLAGRRQRALFNHYNQLTGKNGLSFGQRRRALQQLMDDDAQRGTVLELLAKQPGFGARLGSACLRGRLSAALALAVTLRNKL